MCRIAIVNDFAERGVALKQNCNQILTKDEQQRQYLLQVIEWYREQFPIAKKRQRLVDDTNSYDSDTSHN
jgi:hypothetical protein